jgi:hypothetical protein
LISITARRPGRRQGARQEATVTPQPQRRCRKTAVVAAAAIFGLGGCTTVADPAAPRDPVGEAVVQPLADLSLLRADVSPELGAAAAEPYRPAADCGAIAAELADLDARLGPDVDAPARPATAAGFAGDVVTGAASLPFRGVVRRLSGAHKRDRAAAAVVLGAMVRRGYLKGARDTLRCEGRGA